MSRELLVLPEEAKKIHLEWKRANLESKQPFLEKLLRTNVRKVEKGEKLKPLDDRTVTKIVDNLRSRERYIGMVGMTERELIFRVEHEIRPEYRIIFQDEPPKKNWLSRHKLGFISTISWKTQQKRWGKLINLDYDELANEMQKKILANLKAPANVISPDVPTVKIPYTQWKDRVAKNKTHE
jgi:hypothetical protein